MSISELEDILCHIRCHHYACGFSEADHLKVIRIHENNYDTFIHIEDTKTNKWCIFSVNKVREELRKLREEANNA